MFEICEKYEGVVPIDAMGCQTDIAEKIIESKADYVLALKENHKNLYKTVQSWFEDLDEKNCIDGHQEE